MSQVPSHMPRDILAARCVFDLRSLARVAPTGHIRRFAAPCPPNRVKAIKEYGRLYLAS